MATLLGPAKQNGLDAAMHGPFDVLGPPGASAPGGFSTI